MLPHYISPKDVRYEKMDNQTKQETSSTTSSQEKDKEQICDYGAMFRAYLYSNPLWYSGTSENSIVTCTLPEAFSPVYSVGKEPSAPSESLKVLVMCVKKDTPFEWTDEYTKLDLEKKIEAYNSLARGMEITLHEDGINFGGHINLNTSYMAFNRPIRVVEGAIPPVHNTTSTSKYTAELTPLLTITSFGLPPDMTEAIYIDNKTTTRQMIVNLFKKLRMINYPRKYALYEYEPQIDETAGTLTKKLTRISDDACPLKVVLNWPIPHCGRALVLMENDSGGIVSGTSEIPYDDIVSKITELKREQLDFQVQKNPHTGSWVSTYSKRNMVSEQAGELTLARALELMVHITVTFIFFVVLFFAMALIFPTNNDSEEKVFERKFPKRFFMKYLQEFFEEFLKNRDLGTAASNRAPEL